MKMTTLVLIALGMVTACGTARGGGIAYGSGFVIPDNSAAGASSSVKFGAIDNLVDTLSIHTYWPITATEGGHPWIGDLVATLTYTPDSGGPSVSCDLFSRVGATSAASTGDSSDLRGLSVFTNWSLFSPGNLWAAAAAVGSNSPVGGAFVPSTRSAAFQYQPLNFVSVFGSSVGPGTWTLNISDHHPGNSGRLLEWSISIFIPAPSSAGLAAAAGAVALRRRR